jgi:porin
MLLVEHYANPTAFNLSERACVQGTCYHAPRELFINELGYKTAAAPGNPFTWLRTEGYYNNTSYNDLKFPGQTTSAFGIQAFADRQIWQTEPDSPLTAYKGFYIGATVGYLDPRAAAITGDYQARIYTFGLFGRPRDQIAFSFQHQVYSRYVPDPVDTSATCLSGTVCVRHALNNATLTYTANIMPGVYVTLGASYVDHPAASYSPNGLAYGSGASPTVPQYNINHSLNLLTSLFTVF